MGKYGCTHMEKNAKGNRETLPNPFLILKPAAEACHKLQASGNMATTLTWKYLLVYSRERY